MSGDKIVRTKTRASGGITAAEKIALDAHTKMWIGRAMRTDPIEPDTISRAILALYADAKLAPPRVVIVPSPRCMAVAGGIAAAIWWIRKNPKTEFAAACGPVTMGAIMAIAADLDTPGAVAAAVEAVGGADGIADSGGRPNAVLVKFFAQCVERWWSMYQGGNMWASYEAFISACRDVIGLDLPEFRTYKAWEEAAINGGFRVLRPEFCIVSDFPEILLVDDRSRPHSDTGPSHRWRDGWELYHIHGVRVAPWIVMSPERITVELIHGETNAEVRRVMRAKYGEGRYLHDTGAKLIDGDVEGARQGAGPRALLEDRDGNRFLVGTDGSTGRVYYMTAPRDAKTCAEAHRALCGFDDRLIGPKS